jgi:hypothetical protein
MLNDDDKARIRLEEIYREEVRRQLHVPEVQTRGERLIAFLNGALGMWLLSSILVGVVTWSYTVWTDSRTAARENEATIEKLDVEIVARITRFRDLLSSATTAESFYLILVSLDNPQSTGQLKVSVFPDLAGRSLSSLLWELRSRVSPAERTAVASALRVSQTISTQAAEFTKRYDNSQEHPSRVPVNPVDVQNARRLIDDAFQLQRWTGLN